MDFVSVRDFRNSSKDVLMRLDSAKELVLTNNGKPTALLVDISENNYDEVIEAFRQARCMRLLNNIWAEASERASERGKLSESDIEAEIAAVRSGI